MTPCPISRKKKGGKRSPREKGGRERRVNASWFPRIDRKERGGEDERGAHSLLRRKGERRRAGCWPARWEGKGKRKSAIGGDTPGEKKKKEGDRKEERSEESSSTSFTF